MAPQFLVVGHITKDLHPGGYTIGGTATFAALTAYHLGVRAAIVTRVGEDFDLGSTFDGIEMVRQPSSATTTFENIYIPEGRIQYLRDQAGPIDPAYVPPEWRKIPMVLLGPVAQEVPYKIVDLLSTRLLAIVPQGWMRTWNSSGLIRSLPWQPPPLLVARSQVLVLSEDDVGQDYALIEAYAQALPLVVVTQGKQGAMLFHRGASRATAIHRPAFKVQAVDPTGAGDVFTTAFLIRLWETSQPLEALTFANCVASFCIEHVGASGLPDRQQVAERLRSGVLAV
ncbi:MAG: ribokinase [Chloroflexi bacterium]|nr:ribokinase [Chloroflexota bacterium]